MWCDEICIVNRYYCLAQSALWKQRIEKRQDEPANIYFIGELITNKPDYLTCDLYETTIESFHSFEPQTQSQKLSQSKQLIRDTLSTQELQYLSINDSLFEQSKFYTFLLSCILCLLVAYGLCCLHIASKDKKKKKQFGKKSTNKRTNNHGMKTRSMTQKIQGVLLHE